MGTNYYHETQDRVAYAGLRCDKCGAVLPVGSDHRGAHIGKSSAGWTFLFHATDEVRSYAEWLAVLERGGHIVDEYDCEIDLPTFRAMVAAKASAPHNHAKEYAGAHDTFLDPEGHAFVDGEFS